MVEALGYDFVRHALAAGVLASILCGVIGTFVVVKRLVFLAGGLAHAAFGGLGFCYWAGLEPLLGAAGVAVGTALLLAGTGGGGRRSPDATIGVLWAVGMAVGAVFLRWTPGAAPNLMSYLFGDILAVSGTDVLLTLGLVILVLLLVAALYHELVATAFDAGFAAVQGVRVRAMNALLMLLTALSVVFLIRLVGIILVIALLTLPPLVGLRLARGLPGVMAVATGVGLLITVGGLALSYRLDLPSGPAIVLLGAALLVVVHLATQVGRRRAA